MAGILYRRNIGSTPQAIAGLKVQTSSYGLPIPIVYGQARAAGNLLWYSDFVSTPQSQSGKGGNPITGYSYKAAIILAICEGPIRGILNTWADKDLKTWTAMAAEGFNLFLGTSSQAAWGYVTTNHSTEALGYQFTAYVARSDWPLTDAGTLRNYTWEVQGFLPFGGPGSILDANPADVINDFLTDPDHGAGADTAILPSLTQYSDYCAAAGLFASPVFDAQRPAMDYLRDLLSGSHSAAVWSGGILKIIPYGDKALTANGVTFTPDNTVQYDLTDDDFVVASPGDDPIKVKRGTPADAFNVVQVEFENRANAYNIEIAEAKEQAAIELYGLRPMPAVKLPWLKDSVTARLVAQLMLQRSLYVRNLYEFKLSWRHCLLEPMDLVSINDAQLGYAQKVVRITEIAEDEQGGLAVIAEDWDLGVGNAAAYPSQAVAGYQPDAGVDPGNTT